MNNEPKGCYDPSEMSVSYKSEGSMPMHHKGVKFICVTDVNGTYRRIDLDDIRRAFAEPTVGNKDPWKHRSIGMLCRTCMFYVQKQLRSDELPEEMSIKHKVGRCRRHAPTMNGYPVCFEDDWCGDHKLDEMKV
jgi:hypothetical protein